MFAKKTMLPALNLPYTELPQKTQAGKPLIFDTVRRQWVALTPEEWVRQQFIHFLIANRQVPAGVIAIERAHKGISDKRTDAQIYDRRGELAALVECKSPSVRISRDTFDQALVYNQVLGAAYILITNGISHYSLHCGPEGYQALNHIPGYNEMIGQKNKK